MRCRTVLLALCLAGCSSSSNQGFGDAASDAARLDGSLVSEGGDDEDAGIYPYSNEDAATVLAALGNDLGLSCPTYTCAGDVPVAGGVVNVYCNEGPDGGNCTFSCATGYAATACVGASGACNASGLCQPTNVAPPPPPVDAGPADAAKD